MEQTEGALIDYKLYRFGEMGQIFRGPAPRLRGAYLAFLGASGTFGRYAEEPYPDLAGTAFGMPALNLGAEGAGPGFFLADHDVLSAAGGARVCVVQAMCAAALSNRMFTVRPRRNQRLHTASDMLCGIFPEVDFTRFTFVHGMLRHLNTLDPGRFKLVVNEMKNAWIGRMQTLLGSIDARTVLFWFSQRNPEQHGAMPGGGALYPHFVDRAMIDAVRPAADGYAECTSVAGLPQDLRVAGEVVLFKPSGTPIDENRDLPSPEMHRAAATALGPEISRLL